MPLQTSKVLWMAQHVFPFVYKIEEFTAVDKCALDLCFNRGGGAVRVMGTLPLFVWFDWDVHQIIIRLFEGVPVKILVMSAFMSFQICLSQLAQQVFPLQVGEYTSTTF